MDSRRLQRELGSHLRRRRVGLGKTQAEVAERVGLQRSSISNIEAGAQAVSLQTFLELADFLEVRPGQFLDSIYEAAEFDRGSLADLPDKYWPAVSNAIKTARSVSARN